MVGVTILIYCEMATLLSLFLVQACGSGVYTNVQVQM
jgi:hypothetical protein